MGQMARTSRRRTSRTIALGAGLVIGLSVALAAPAAAGTAQIAGVGVLDTTGVCGSPPAGYAAFTDFTIVMSGSLDGCWYTDIQTTKDHGSPSGIYQERGEEVFVGTVDGRPAGTFATTYVFSSKWDPDVSTGAELHGSCHHPIAAGTGNGGFEGVTGRLDFKDEVATGRYLYRGHLSFR